VILKGVRPPLLYNVVAAASWPVLHWLFRLRVQGRENVPESGGYVLASNHLSNFDPWPLGMPLWPQRWLRFMAKAELYWWPATLVLNAAGAFPVHRERADVEAVQTAVRLAQEGNVVVMFPEGTRRKKGLVKKHQARARSGAARIALDAGVPLVPAAIAGTDRLLTLGPLKVAFGAPIDVDDLLSLDDTRRASQEATERLMARIAELEASL
jgi:1-acyl-sn-glycerol-3-phosphate acyltransferase